MNKEAIEELKKLHESLMTRKFALVDGDKILNEVDRITALLEQEQKCKTCAKAYCCTGKCDGYVKVFEQKPAETIEDRHREILESDVWCEKCGRPKCIYGSSFVKYEDGEFSEPQKSCDCQKPAEKTELEQARDTLLQSGKIRSEVVETMFTEATKHQKSAKAAKGELGKALKQIYREIDMEKIIDRQAAEIERLRDKEDDYAVTGIEVKRLESENAELKKQIEKLKNDSHS
jgi:hypothetical protein